MNFIIYGKPNCPFCTNAKILLEQREQAFKYLTLDEDYSLDQIQNLVLEKTGVLPRTFPQIFVEDGEHLTHVGGFSELREFMAQIAE